MSTVVAKNLTVQNSAGTSSTNISFDGTKLVSTALDNSIVATANLHDLGVGQTWQDAELVNTGAVFTDGSSKFRASGVTYTNTTGKPIMVSIPIGSGIGIVSLKVNSIVVGYSTVSTGVLATCCAIVPSGATYRSDIINGTPSLAWRELR